MHYVHHVPGRLRIRASSLKRNPGEIERVRGCMARLPGVIQVRAADVTGSITISYDPAVTGRQALLAALAADCEYLAHGVATPVSAPDGQTNWIALFGKALLGYAVEAAVVHSTRALVGSLL